MFYFATKRIPYLCRFWRFANAYFTLEKKGFVRLLLEGNNSVRIELTDKVGQYAEEIGERHSQFLKLLFTDFNEDEIDLLFRLYVKLFAGIERVEKYAEKLG